MQNKEFMALLKQANAVSTKATAGKADWDAIIAEATETGQSYTITRFQKELVKGAVSKGRTRRVLGDLFEAKKVARLLMKDGAYHYCFDPEAIKIQHGE